MVESQPSSVLACLKISCIGGMGYHIFRSGYEYVIVSVARANDANSHDLSADGEESYRNAVAYAPTTSS